MQSPQQRKTYNPKPSDTRKAWGDTWKKLQAAARSRLSNGKAPILFGKWNGYRSSQDHNVHVDLATNYIGFKDMDGMVLRTIVFTDGTTMDVWIEWLTPQEILDTDLRRTLGYVQLMRTAIAKGEARYVIE